MFMTLLRHAQRAGSFNEEHTYYCEAYCHALMHTNFLRIGKRFAKAGAIKQPEDIFFLIPDEIERAIHAPQAHNLNPIVECRRKQWEGWSKVEKPPMLTIRPGMKEAFADIMAARLAGAKVAAGEIPVVRPELNADLYGICGSPGTCKGIARVVKEIDQLGDVQPGEILVAPSTSTSWTPVFAIVKGAVIDRGGALAHAAVVGREYGIPVILNVFEGTTKIKTGQMINVDATQGLVYIDK
jgi:pyruvate, water dikinase